MPWAGNFLFDSSSEPHRTADELSAAFGVAKSTMSSKAKQVRDLLKMSYFGAEFLRADVVAGNPMVWLIEVDGLAMDSRNAPDPLSDGGVPARVHSLHPGLGPAGTAALMDRGNPRSRPVRFIAAGMSVPPGMVANMTGGGHHGCHDRSGSLVGQGPVLTVADMGDMPDDEFRYELDDGVLIVSPAPSRLHQLAVARLTVILSAACPAGLVVLPGVGVNITRFQHRVPDVAVVRGLRLRLSSRRPA